MNVNTTENLYRGPIAKDSNDSHLSNVAHVVRNIGRYYCTNRSASYWHWHQLEGMSVYGDRGGGVKSERHRPARDCSDEAVVLVPNDVQHI
jgi:hypothetical protein